MKKNIIIISFLFILSGCFNNSKQIVPTDNFLENGNINNINSKEQIIYEKEYHGSADNNNGGMRIITGTENLDLNGPLKKEYIKIYPNIHTDPIDNGGINNRNNKLGY